MLRDVHRSSSVALTGRIAVRIEARLRELGLVLPEPVKPPPGVRLPFAPVRVIGDRALISGHGPQQPDVSIAGPFGKVGADVTVEQGYQAARLTALSRLGSLARELGDLDRITQVVQGHRGACTLGNVVGVSEVMSHSRTNVAVGDDHKPRDACQYGL